MRLYESASDPADGNRAAVTGGVCRGILSRGSFAPQQNSRPWITASCRTRLQTRSWSTSTRRCRGARVRPRLDLARDPLELPPAPPRKPETEPPTGWRRTPDRTSRTVLMEAHFVTLSAIRVVDHQGVIVSSTKSQRGTWASGTCRRCNARCTGRECLQPSPERGNGRAQSPVQRVRARQWHPRVRGGADHDREPGCGRGAGVQNPRHAARSLARENASAVLGAGVSDLCCGVGFPVHGGNNLRPRIAPGAPVETGGPRATQRHRAP